MIDAKEAVRIAIDYYKDVCGESFSGLQLEELDMTEHEDHWLVTLSYVENPLAALMGEPKRSYKIFKISRETGQVVSMKIREIK